MRPVRLPVSLLLAAGLALTACSGDEEQESAPGPQEVADGVEFGGTWPLTGEPVAEDQTAEQEWPVLVVKIDNTESSSPQVGLGSADLVVEELVEGGLTRLAVFFYSDIPDTVGPVRSMRASDIGIVTPADAAVVTSGAAAQTIARVRKAGITYFNESAKGMYREESRSAPYNLFARLADIAKEEGGEPARPDDYLPWGSAEDLPGGRPAKTLAIGFSAGRTTNWQLSGGSYRNTNSYAGDGDEFVADTVLVLRVKVGDAGYTDPAGNPVPESKFTGTGNAWLFHKGRAVLGTWHKDGLDGELELRTRAGELEVPPGHVWVELMPASTGRVEFK